MAGASYAAEITRPQPDAGPATRRARTPDCLCRVAPAAPARGPHRQIRSLPPGDRNVAVAIARSALGARTKAVAPAPGRARSDLGESSSRASRRLTRASRRRAAESSAGDRLLTVRGHESEQVPDRVGRRHCFASQSHCVSRHTVDVERRLVSSSAPGGSLSVNVRRDAHHRGINEP